MVLAYERKELPPNFAELLQKDMSELFLKYPQFDAKNIEVEIKNDKENAELWISIPFNKNRNL
ncbi:cell division topological specificity factor MinE [Candidatus Magnetoovum chiemensis]|nr:cell division topological specificity factor MinE [Candidatus Magnetoovum chiemensis]